jgi:hypothetical protein
VTVAEPHIEPFLPADVAVGQAAVWIAMRAAVVVAGFAALQFRAFCVRRAVGGGWAHD